MKVSAALPRKWVSRVIASEHELGTVYVSMTGYREDDFRSYLFRSGDFGQTWTSISNNLPAESINVVREDPKRAGALYVGTDAGIYVSLDRGATWHSLCADLPTTPVHDLVVHPREDELIAVTHGRSLFLLDVRPIQALSDEIRGVDFHAFDIRPVRLTWQVPREVPPYPPPARVRIHYWMKTPGPVTIAVRDADGRPVRTIIAQGVSGINRLTWDARTDEGREVAPGNYRVDLAAGKSRVSATVILRPGF